MKKLIKIGLLSAALITSVVVKASDKLNVIIGSKTSKIVSISLTETVENEIVYIKDIDGTTLFSENLKKSSVYNKVFNFSTLPNGLYFVESKTENRILSTPLVVSELGVKIVNKSVKTYTAPEITIEENHIKVLVRNHNAVPVSITIYDEDGILLNVVEGNDNSIVYGHYDASDLRKKSIIVSVSEGDYSFVKEIKL